MVDTMHCVSTTIIIKNAYLRKKLNNNRFIIRSNTQNENTRRKNSGILEMVYRK